MISNLLAESNNNWYMWVVIGVVVVLLVVWLFLSNRKNKRRQQEYNEQLDAIGPGNKVKTAGGICGIVVEVCDDNTVIIETGSEQSGKSYVKMDKELIAQTDAKGPSQIAREEAEARRKAEKEGKTEQVGLEEPSQPEDAESAPSVAEIPAAEEIPAETTPVAEAPADEAVQSPKKAKKTK